MELGLYDIVNRHQIYLEGLKLGQVKSYQPTVVALDKLIREHLSMLPFYGLSDMSKASVKAFLAKFKKAMANVYNIWLRNQLAWLERYINEDVNLWSELYSSAADKPIAEEDKPDSTKVFVAWKNAPLGANGVLPIVMLTDMVSAHVGQAVLMLNRGYAAQWSREELVAALRGTQDAKFRDGLLNRFNNNTAATLNTIIQAANAQANIGVARLFWDRYEWVSVLDDRTTKICRSLDGKIFVYGKGPLPPAHVGCRSDTKPYDGVKSPDDTFGVWARRQSAAFKDDAFDGRETSAYEGTKPLTLEQFRSKSSLILSV